MITETHNKKTGVWELHFSGKDLRNLEECAQARGESELQKVLHRLIEEDIARGAPPNR